MFCRGRTPSWPKQTGLADQETKQCRLSSANGWVGSGVSDPRRCRTRETDTKACWDACALSGTNSYMRRTQSRAYLCTLTKLIHAHCCGVHFTPALGLLHSTMPKVRMHTRLETRHELPSMLTFPCSPRTSLLIFCSVLLHCLQGPVSLAPAPAHSSGQDQSPVSKIRT